MVNRNSSFKQTIKAMKHTGHKMLAKLLLTKYIKRNKCKISYLQGFGWSEGKVELHPTAIALNKIVVIVVIAAIVITII